MSETASIRRIGPDDAELLSRLAARLFRQAYEAAMSAGDLEAYVAEEFTPSMQLEELNATGWITLVASVAGQDVGYIQVRSNPSPEGVEDPAGAELKRIYVDRSVHGGGVAAALLDAGREAAASLGHDRIWLSVWKQNPRAIAFYRKHGFDIVGEASFQLADELQWDHVMAAPLAEASASMPWQADRPMDAAIALAAVQEALPGLTSDVTELGSGWAFDTYGLGLEWVARFPRRASVMDTIGPELEVLERVAEPLKAVGVDVPHLHALAGPTEGFPYRFLVQKRIWGMPLDALRRGRFSPMLAKHLGEVLSTLHSQPVGDLAVESQPLDERLAEVRDSVVRLDSDTGQSVAEEVGWLQSTELPPAYEGPARLTHNDLGPDHIRVARTGIRVIGLLDWTDVAAGDPARDFVGLYAWAGAQGYRRVLSGYTLERDDGFDQRVRFLARVGSLKWLADAVTQGTDVQKHLSWVKQAFAE